MTGRKRKPPRRKVVFVTPKDGTPQPTFYEYQGAHVAMPKSRTELHEMVDISVLGRPYKPAPAEDGAA
jgi:hypothetical protein